MKEGRKTRFWGVGSCRQSRHTPGFIRQMPTSIRAHLATQPDSTLLESLATLADRALASESDGKETNVYYRERSLEGFKNNQTYRRLWKRLERLETSGVKKKHFNNKPPAASRSDRTFVKSLAFPDFNAKTFISDASQNQASQQVVFSWKQKGRPSYGTSAGQTAK